MGNQDLDYLFRKAVQHQCSKEELERLHELLTDPANREEYERLFDLIPVQVEANVFSRDESDRILDKILSGERQPGMTALPSKRKKSWYWPAAASFLLLAGAYTVYKILFNTSPNIAYDRPVELAVNNPIKEVTLTLSDGKTISLDQASTSAIIEKDTKVLMEDHKSLKYQSMDEKIEAGLLKYNTLAIPRGRTFKLTLPDGSVVMLNAGTTISYPVQFSGSERRVTISGEAYFEIAKDENHPFKINTELQEVVVLGTEFNVKAYPGEGKVTTTLKNGSVKVLCQNSKDILLQPGMSTISTQNTTLVTNADLKVVTAWKENIFYFKDTELKEVTRELQRWYDIEVDYNSLPSVNLYGEIPRDIPLNQLLKAMEKTTGLNFEIHNDTLKVNKL